MNHVESDSSLPLRAATPRSWLKAARDRVCSESLDSLVTDRGQRGVCVGEDKKERKNKKKREKERH